MSSAKIDLHLHLDGSLNIKWAYDKAIQRGIIEDDTSFEDFYHLLFSNNDVHSAKSIRKFDLTCALLQHREDLFAATYDLCRRLNEMGLIYAELRFASQHHTKKGLSQLEALEAVVDGAKKAMADFEIRVGIINCMMHKGDSESFNHDENIETIEVSKKLLNKGLVGLDLAGYENNCEFKDYGNLFELARSYNIPYTIHAGEMGQGQHILEALEMLPNRIGHGIDCIQDERYLKAILEAQVPLEVCVTSNIKTTLDYASHPVRTLLSKGLKVTVNTDNMMFSKTDLVNEHNQLRMIGVDDLTLRKCTLNALDAAFCDDETKEYLRSKI